MGLDYYGQGPILLVKLESNHALYNCIVMHVPPLYQYLMVDCPKGGRVELCSMSVYPGLYLQSVFDVRKQNPENK